ncbi:unnamed protein product [Plutella xylostella]|uniref:(diamondback moth) hypothetical protein n=1 Tax=Plutella xylostella TaxID=51655 RepID=A0A8S4FX22_PLUXY|nr:unnamed protein product [Plutella xylostella]
MVSIEMQLPRSSPLPRSITKINYEALEKNLLDINWDPFYQIEDPNTACDTPSSALNLVNDYFTSVGSTLANDILTSSNLTEKQLTSRIEITPRLNSFSLFLTPTDTVETSKFIMSLKSDGSPGWDELPPKLFKNLKHIIAEPIAHIINLSISSGIVPELLKLSEVCPIYKDGDTTDPCNYRPISLLTVTAKILEKVINHRLTKYLESNKQLAENQFGFRAKRSTEDAVTLLTDSIASSLDKGERCIGVFLDLKKAFDTVSIPLLLKKLEALGGSVLGPTLFLAYINDICRMEAVSAQVLAFADDTALLFRGDTWENVKAKAEEGLMQSSIAVFLWTGYKGTDYYKQYVIGSYDVASLFEIGIYATGLGINLPVSAYNVYQSYKLRTGKMRSFLEAIRPLWALLSIFSLCSLWAHQSPRRVVQRDPRAVFLLVGTLFSNVACLKTKVFEQCVLPVMTYGAETWSLT